MLTGKEAQTKVSPYKVKLFKIVSLHIGKHLKTINTNEIYDK